MEAWYTSEKRFIARIVRRWKKQGFNYNAGNVNILRYAFRTLMYWATVNGYKVSKQNLVNTQPKLF